MVARRIIAAFMMNTHKILEFITIICIVSAVSAIICFFVRAS